MDIKPMYNTETIKFQNSTIQPTKLESKVIADPSGSIPNGIYKVIHWEKRRQLFTFILSLLVIFSAIALIGLYASIWKTSWMGFILPTSVILVATWMALNSQIERTWLKRSVNRYREDLRIGLTSTPPFIAKLYMNLHRKQVRHNWATFFLMFYGGIFTVLLWWLKDVSFWIFHFNEWISALFSNPTLMSWIFAASLLSIILIYLILTIQRKKRILEIEAYFGGQLMPISELEVLKRASNKMYRRLFLISIMIILIIPIFIRIMFKIIRRK